MTVWVVTNQYGVVISVVDREDKADEFASKYRKRNKLVNIYKVDVE